MRVLALSIALVGALALPGARVSAQERLEPAKKQECATVGDARAPILLSARVGHSEPLREPILAYLRAAGVESPTGFFALDADSGHVRMRATFVESNVPEEAYAGVRPIVMDYLARQGKRPVAVFFRLDEVVLPPVVPGETVYCAPFLKNESRVKASMRGLLSAHSRPGRVRREGGRQASLRFLVSRTGKVVNIDRGRGSGDPDIDPYLPSLALLAEYHPALVDGVPVDTWVDMSYLFEIL